MNHRSSSRLDRREFLKLGGAALVGLAAGCTLRKRAGTLPAELMTQPTLAKTVPPFNTPAPQGPPSGVADMILKSGKVFTVDAGNSIAQAVAVKDGLLQAVGSDEAIGALAGPQTQIIDLVGRAASPGFIDPHIHFRAWGLQNTYYMAFMPPDVTDIPGLQKRLAELLKTKPAGEWVMAYYLVLKDKSIPTKEDLDPVSPNNPVFIMHIGGHWGTANSAALQLAGVDKNTQSPSGGIIEKDKSGELTGVLYNHRAMDVVRRFAPQITTEMISQSTLDTQKAFTICGVTSFQDNNIRAVQDIEAYQQLTRDGQLVMRNDLYLTLEYPADLAKLDQVQHVNDQVTRFAGYKFLIDGQVPTSYCHQPHNGASWEMPTWEPAAFKQVVRTLHDTGLQICVHSIGDAAADLVLDAYEEAMNANPRSDPRHRIEHAILTTPQATRRAKDLGVVMSVNPAFIYVFGISYESLYGAERMPRIIVTREWLDAGLHVCIGSDAPSMPLYNPQFTMAGAMSRLTFKETVLGPEQVMTFEEALRAHTIEAAYAAHEENLKGSLEAGKLADIVVWPQDPSTLDIESLAMTTVMDMTIIGGKVVHQV